MPHIRILQLAVAISLAISPAALPTVCLAQECSPSWQFASPTQPVRDNFCSIAYGENMLVAIGNRGTIHYSRDGSAWSVANPQTRGSALCVTWGNGRFVVYAIESSGACILISADGIHWARWAFPYREFVTSLRYEGGLFFGMGSFSYYTSPDGRSWSEDVSPEFSPFEGLAYGNGIFVATNMNGWHAYTSRDARTWSPLPNPPEGCYKAVAFGDGRFVMAGAISVDSLFFSSQDGLNWEKGSYTGINIGPEKIFFGGGKWLVYGEINGRITSDDGRNWVFHPLDLDCPTITATFGAGRFFGIGLAVCQSEDGVEWQQLVPVEYCMRFIHCIAWRDTPRMAVAVASDGAVLASQNGRSGWTPVFQDRSLRLLGVTSGGGSWVAVGGSGAILFSADGSDWETVNSGFQVDLNAVSYGAGLFVAVGSRGVVLTSSDGKNWTQRDMGIRDDLLFIVWGGGRFVAAGANGIFLTSTEGRDWSFSMLADFVDPVGLSFGGGRFVLAERWTSSLYSSENGLDWTCVFQDFHPLNLVRTGDYFISNSLLGTTGASTDGMNWKESYPFGSLTSIRMTSAGDLLLGTLECRILWSDGCRPVLSEISPDTGPPAGGGAVAIKGEHLRKTEGVYFGDCPASGFSILSDEEIIAVAPPHAPGPLQVMIDTPAGTSDISAAGEFACGDRPAITSIKKLSGPLRLSISGQYFSPSCTVNVDGVPFTPVVYKGPTQLLLKSINIKSRFPKGRPVKVTVTDNSTMITSRPYTYTR